MEERKPSYAVGGNVNWCSHCFKNKYTDQWNRELRNKPTHIWTINLQQRQQGYKMGKG